MPLLKRKPSFLENDKPRDMPKELKALYKLIDKEVDRCSGFDSGCPSCRCYVALDILRDFFEE